MNPRRYLLATIASLYLPAAAQAEVRTRTENLPLQDGSGFAFKQIARPASNDAAAGAKITIASGERDQNGGAVSRLNDGRLPTGDDQPAQNFFFSTSTNG